MQQSKMNNREDSRNSSQIQRIWQRFWFWELPWRNLDKETLRALPTDSEGLLELWPSEEDLNKTSTSTGSEAQKQTR